MGELSEKRMPDVGLLVLRVIIGLSFLFVHGGPKLLGGPERWEGIGKMGMGVVNIQFGLIFWGFIAALFEALGGLGILLGIGTRSASVMILLIMIPAALAHMLAGHYGKAVYPVEIAAIVFCLAFTGPGRYSLRSLLHRKKPHLETP